MAFSLQQFVGVRPYLYHLTAPGNLPRIRAVRCLESVEELLMEAGARPRLASGETTTT